MKMIFWALVILMFFVAESIYCYLRKKKDSIRIAYKNGADQTQQLPDNISADKQMLRYVLTNLLDGFTFLLFKLIGYIPSHFIRNMFYRSVFHMKIGNKAVIYYGLEVRSPWNIEIGNNSIIGDRCILDARFGIKIGENVNLSTGVWIWTLQHDVNSPYFSSDGQGGQVIIDDRVWVSSRVSILPGIHVKKGCVIASGAVVTKNCDEGFSLYGGVPAKKIGARNTELKYEFDGKHRLFI